MKITFGIIVLNGDFLLKQVLQSIYPFAHAICIAEGPVNYWANIKGITTSIDDTNKILEEFPDPENKIKVTHGIYSEKDEQCRAWFKDVPIDTDYVFCVDADEIHSRQNILKLIKYLEKHKPDSIGFKSDSFFGGFERIIGGFERDHSFKRVLKYIPGCIYRTHRQPTLSLNGLDIDSHNVIGTELFEKTGITMWHGSYVSPKMVHDKISYYESAVIKKGLCIPNYFTEVWLKWVLHPELREEIETTYKGVQEFVPRARGECYTLPYSREHPQIIKDSMKELVNKFNQQLKQFI